MKTQDLIKYNPFGCISLCIRDKLISI